MKKLRTEKEIIQSWNTDYFSPLVSIHCTAYNHEAFIKKAIEGFLIQETDFPIEILIHDDASTDKTPEVIRFFQKKYPEIIKPIYQNENQYSKGIGIIGVTNLSRAKGKYTAVCEGDDYWITKDKLQTQVNFLESNPEYGMVSTDMFCIDEKGHLIPEHIFRVPGTKLGPELSFFDLLDSNKIYTLTTCIKTDLYRYLTYRAFNEKLWFTYDHWYWLQIAIRSKIRIFSEKTAYHIEHPGGISKSTDFFNFRKKSFLFYDVIESFSHLCSKKLNKEEKQLLIEKICEILKKKECPLHLKLNWIKILKKYDPFFIHSIVSIVPTLKLIK